MLFAWLHTQNATGGTSIHTEYPLWAICTHKKPFVGDLYTQNALCGDLYTQNALWRISIYTKCPLWEIYTPKLPFVGDPQRCQQQKKDSRGPCDLFFAVRLATHAKCHLWDIYTHRIRFVGDPYTQNTLCGRPIHTTCPLWEIHTHKMPYSEHLNISFLIPPLDL